jgi:hypothetical protein
MKQSLFIIVCFFALNVHAQKNKFDTTMKIGKVGYRVTCNNKANEKSDLSISLIGFEESRNEINLDIKGKVFSAEIDDLNRDGFPDLIIYIFSEGDKRIGKVLAIASENNKGINAITFPDITDDPKLSLGYKGGDVFKLFNGILTRRFPVYNTTDSTNAAPTGIVRQIIYKVVYGERGAMKFKVDRSIDIDKPKS